MTHTDRSPEKVGAVGGAAHLISDMMDRGLSDDEVRAERSAA